MHIFKWGIKLINTKMDRIEECKMERIEISGCFSFIFLFWQLSDLFFALNLLLIIMKSQCIICISLLCALIVRVLFFPRILKIRNLHVEVCFFALFFLLYFLFGFSNFHIQSSSKHELSILYFSSHFVFFFVCAYLLISMKLKMQLQN